MQNHYNLAYRETEREIIPICRERDIGVTPWSSLARGFLARPHDKIEATDRGSIDHRLEDFPYAEGNGLEINERVEQIAEDEGATMAQIALAWLLYEDVVDAPIVGTTSVEHLEQAVEALEISLSDSDLENLEESCEPVEVVGPK